MIEGIKEIGEIILSKAPEKFLESLTLNVRSEKQGKKQHIVIIEFDTQKGTINFDSEEIREESARKYLWVGIGKGAKSQIYLTTSGNKKFGYLFTKNLSEVVKKCEGLEDVEIKNLEKIGKGIIARLFDSSTGCINPSKFVCYGRKLVETVAEQIIKDFKRAENEIKSVRNKSEAKVILKRLFGKESNCKSYLPDNIFKQWRKESEQTDKFSPTNFETLLNNWELSLPERISKRFSEDIKKIAKVKNIDESKLSFLKALLSEHSLNYRDIALVSVKVVNSGYNGILVKHPGYRKLLEDEKINQIFNKSHKKKEYKEKVSNGICSLCEDSEKELVSSNTTNFRFKFYMTDKVGFSKELKGDFLGNYTLCKNCYQKVMAGEVFIMNKLQSRIGDMPVYIIPKFIFRTSLSQKQLEKWSGYIKSSFNSTVSLEALQRFQDEIKDYIDCEKEKNNLIFNILFYERTQSEFSILKLIKDVPPSRLDILRGIETKVHDIGVRLLGKDDRWYLNLGRMYYLFPVRMSRTKGGGRKEVVDYKKVLEFYNSLFSSKPVSYKFLIEQFVDLACVYRFKKFVSYNIGESDSDLGLVYAILKANLLLLYLRELNLLEGGKTMDIENLNLNPEMKEYIKEMGYSEPRVMLFLLGHLIGEVGNAQYSSENRTKPVLNKITYQGMNVGKILRLTNEIFEKLKQYKRLSYNEGVFGEMKKLLDKCLENWKLSDQENVFYVLSGYAYNTYKALAGGKQKESNDEQKGGKDEQQ